MQSKKVEFIRNGLFVSIAQIGSFFSTLSLLGILTNEFDTSSFGLLGTVLALSMLLQQSSTGPLNSSIIRFFSHFSSEFGTRSVQIALFVWMVRVGLMVLIASVSLSSVFLFIYNPNQASTYVSLASLSLLFGVISGLNGSLNSFLLGANRQAAISSFQLLIPVTRLIFVWAGLELFDSDVQVVLWLYVTSALTVLLVQLRYLDIPISAWLLGPESLILTKIKPSIISYAMPVFVWGMANGFFVSADRWLLGHFGSLSAVAHYVVLYQIGFTSFSQASVVLCQLIMPLAFKLAGDGTGDNLQMINSLAKKFLGFGILVALLSFGVAYQLQDEILYLVISKDYLFDPVLFPLMCVSGCLFGVAQAAATGPLSSSKITDFALFRIKCYVLGFGFMLLLIYYKGLHGAVIAQLIYTLIFSIGLYFFISTKLKKSVM